ncbi:putative F-box protein At3g16210 [Neltuma alba]|uniref:putative F-box protein At3g16210 n=1 Tax=Neltuma alba TaxID=207710 RepID=UPI0010A56FCF|nr:putative F-box protein At3g16210 [Prosopis alba]
MVMSGAAPFLPDEIITYILTWLPVKSLMRFRCVCKHWKNLFKTPSFIQDHLRHSTHQNPSLVIGHSNRGEPCRLYLLDCEMQFCEFEKTPFLGSLVDTYIVGSCNGLLCLADYTIRPATPLLWNPATREVRQIPITFNDTAFGWNFGFGFSPVINDYKIVRFSLNPYVCGVEVYSLSTGSWRNIQFDNIKGLFVLSDGITVNGVMFWHAPTAAGIVSFDLATEVFTVTPWPAFASYSRELAVFKNKLAILYHSRTRNSQYSCLSLGVMVDRGMGSSGERWVSCKKHIYNICNSDLHLCAGTIWRNEIVFIYLGMPTFTDPGMEDVEGLYLFNVNTNELKLLATPRLQPLHAVSVFHYVESLVPLGNIQIEELNSQG